MKGTLQGLLILIALLGIFIGGYAVGIKEIDAAVERERQKNYSLLIEAKHINEICIEDMKKSAAALEKSNKAMSECIETMKFINNEVMK